MEFQEILSQRKSVRNFKPQAVVRTDILTIIQAGMAAPSPCNQQLWRFVVVDDPKIKERLIGEAYSSTIIRRAGSIIVVIYDGWNYKEAIQSGSMAIMNMLNCSWELQIGSCSINSFGNEKKIKKILAIPDSYVIVAFVLLGYSDDLKNPQVPLVARRPVDQVISFNMYESVRDYLKSYDPQSWKIEDLNDYQRYFCRKTFLGKTMDLVSDYEIKVIESELKNLPGNILDVFSYDGSYLKFLPKTKIISLNLNDVTGRYALSALPLDEKGRSLLENLTWDELLSQKKDLQDIRQVTMIMKSERVSQKIFSDLLETLGQQLTGATEFTLISRKRNFFLNAFLFFLRLVFGDDVRKTGMFAFWGPFCPIDVKEICALFKAKGWKCFEQKQYFFFPAFFQQVLQMVFQYYKSGKTSYVHRSVHRNFITESYGRLLKFQGLKETGHGSLVVLKFCLEKRL